MCDNCRRQPGTHVWFGVIYHSVPDEPQSMTRYVVMLGMVRSLLTGKTFCTVVELCG